MAQSVNQNPEPLSNFSEGQILFSPMWGTTTYLVDCNGTLNHTWSSSYFPGVSVWWLGDGTILRSIRIGGGPVDGGAGGGVQIIQWDGTITWDFRYNTNGHFSHHDVKSLPNGNVLLIAWETKTPDQAIAAGRNPDYVSNQYFLPDHIVEVKPTGPSTGDIVWEWHVWDHLIQDYDSSKTNYGVVQDHPELIDVNLAPTLKTEWMHTNSIDYNQELDQILISVRNLNEIWVIDHSTTTAQAASHTGGNSGKGGDLLYRWGNPINYQRGTSNDQKLFLQHDATWIDQGCPGAGNILVFNNGDSDRHYSSVDEIIPPINNDGMYYLLPDSTYGPERPTWIYQANPPTNFYASYLSGAQRLPSGNTLICNGVLGKIFEVTPEGAIAWQYTNPYPYPSANGMFKIVYIPPEEPPGPNVPDLECIGDLSWNGIKAGTTVRGSFQLENAGSPNSQLNWSINNSSIQWGTWTITPESGLNLKPEDGKITIEVTVVTPKEKNSKFEGYIKVENQENPEDFELLPVYLKTSNNRYAFHTFIELFLLKLERLY